MVLDYPDMTVYNLYCLTVMLPYCITFYAEYKPGMKQYFKVRAVDYWKRPGVYSDSVYY